MTREVEGDSLIVFTNSGAMIGDGPGVLKDIFKNSKVFVEQRGADIWERMKNAFFDMFDLGYESLVLIGADIPEITSKNINESLDSLVDHDIVITPTEDGGYCLIGMNNINNRVFEMSDFRGDDVVGKTLDLAFENGERVHINPTLLDIDEEEDIIDILSRFERDRMPNTWDYLNKLGY